MTTNGGENMGATQEISLNNGWRFFMADAIGCPQYAWTNEVCPRGPRWAKGDVCFCAKHAAEAGAFKAPERNDTPERNDVDHGGRVEVGDVWKHPKYGAWAATASNIPLNAPALLDPTQGWRLVSRISPAPAAPKERVLKKEWRRLTGGEVVRCWPKGSKLLESHGPASLVNGAGDLYCAPCAEAACAYVDVAPSFAAGIDRAVPGSERHVEQVWRDGKCISEKVTAPRPLTFDEANPRPVIDGFSAGCDDVNPVTCEPGYLAWDRAQLGRAPGIDSERVRRPVGKVRPEYLEEVDRDFVGLLGVEVRR